MQTELLEADVIANGEFVGEILFPLDANELRLIVEDCYYTFRLVNIVPREEID
jgi:hypothetical protein